MTRLSAFVNATAVLVLFIGVYGSEQIPLTKSKIGHDPFTDQFDKLVEEAIHHWKVPGLAIGVIDGDDVFARGYGIATFPDTPATPETLWYGASTTKAQLAAAIALFIDNETFPELSQGWSTPISSVIRDDFVLQDEWATAHLTLEDAVSHRTGMSRHDMATRREIDGRPAAPRDVVRNLRNLKMAFEPRVKWSYCNLMFITLSHLVETLTGKWLGDTLKELIWRPLEMHSTYFSLDDAQNAPEHLAAGYKWDLEEEVFKEVAFMPVSEESGAGAVLSNVLDYSKWVKCLLHEAAPFSREVHRDIQTPRMLAAPPSEGLDVQLYGLGWIRTTFKGHTVYMHGGGMHAYGSQVMWLPELKYGIVSFGNTALTSNAVEEILSWHLIQDKLGLPLDERLDISKQWEEVLRKRFSPVDLTTAIKKLYPGLPEQPLPPTTNTSQLVGYYSNPGYGTIQLREQAHPSKSGESILVADLPELAWISRLQFHHVSGDNWIAIVVKDYAPASFYEDYTKAWFTIGVDGKATSLAHQLSNPSSEVDQGTIYYDRLA